MASDIFLQAVGAAGGAGGDRFVVEEPLEVGGEFAGRAVTAGPVTLEGFEGDPVKITAQFAD